MSLAKNWCFTLNNYTDAELDALKALEESDVVSYVIFQEETGEEGTPHIQGYLQLAGKKRMAGVKRIVGDRSHVSVARGTAAQNRDYCSKADSRTGNCYEFGNMTGKGARKDIEALVEASKENEINEKFLMENFSSIYARFPNFCTRLRKMQQEAKVTSQPFVPRTSWQRNLADLIDSEPHPRKVIWYVDEIGNTGKSTFANNYHDGENVRPYVITGGKFADILYSYDYERCVIFDLPRTIEDRVPYGVMESFKNGYFLSTKYEVKRVRFNVPHVIVFANFEPDRSKLSADRWDVRHIRVLDQI